MPSPGKKLLRVTASAGCRVGREPLGQQRKAAPIVDARARLGVQRHAGPHGRLHVHASSQDLRQLVVVTTAGEILEPLLASGPWREHPHSQWLRRAFFKAKRLRQLDFAAGDDPIEAFLAHRRKEAHHSR